MLEIIIKRTPPVCVVSVLETYNIVNCSVNCILAIIHFTVIFKIKGNQPIIQYLKVRLKSI